MRALTQHLSAGVLSLTTITAIAGVSTSVQAQQMMSRGPVCGERTALVDQLKGKYSEQPKSMGLAANGSILEILTAKTGTWTVLVTSPQGVTCLIAAGEHWEEMEQRKADYTPS
jgi:hypothetical protein